MQETINTLQQQKNFDRVGLMTIFKPSILQFEVS